MRARQGIATTENFRRRVEKALAALAVSGLKQYYGVSVSMFCNRAAAMPRTEPNSCRRDSSDRARSSLSGAGRPSFRPMRHLRIMKPDGVVGDLGGGSLELIDVKGSHAAKA